MTKFALVILGSALLLCFIRSEVVKRSTLTCEANEMSVECSFCGPKTCEDLGTAVPCSGATGVCRPTCVCIDGYVRDTNETCILKTECPSCGGDFNATTGCGNHCGNSCSDYKEVNKTCLTGCKYNSCSCRDGYVYHDKLQFCVLPVDCYIPGH